MSFNSFKDCLTLLTVQYWPELTEHHIFIGTVWFCLIVWHKFCSLLWGGARPRISAGSGLCISRSGIQNLKTPKNGFQLGAIITAFTGVPAPPGARAAAPTAPVAAPAPAVTPAPVVAPVAGVKWLKHTPTIDCFVGFDSLCQTLLTAKSVNLD